MKKSIVESVTRRVKGEARKKKQKVKAEINELGQEVLDETPLFLEVGQKPKETLDQKIRRVTQQVQADTVAKLKAQQMSEEEVQAILDEENDFTIPEDLENTLTPYELQGVVSDLEEEVVLVSQDQPVTENTEVVAESVSSSSPAEPSAEGATESVSP